MSLNTDVSSIFSKYRLVVEQQEEMLQAVNANQQQEEDRAKTVKEIPKEVWDKFTDRLTGAKKFLRNTWPFYFFVLDGLRTVPTLDVPTMAVDDFSNVYINPYFALNELTLQETAGVLAHEASHVFSNDFFRRGSRDPQLWNVAADYVINKILLRDGHKLPVLGCLPKLKGNRWYIEEQDKLTGNNLSIDITELTREEVYEQLRQNWEKKKEIIKQLVELQKQLDEHLDGEMDPGEGSGSEGKGEKEGKGKGSGGPDPVEIEGGEQIPGKYKPDREAPGEPKKSQGEKEAKAKNATNKAIEDAKQDRGTGSGIPTEMDMEVNAPTVNWRNILRQFLKLGAKSHYNIMRPNKRAMSAGYYAPRLEREQNKLDAVVTLDTSGSISDGMVKAFVSEVIGIIKTAPSLRVLIIFWESHGYSPRKDGKPMVIEGNKTSLAEAENQLKSVNISRGGTSLSSMTDYYNQVKSKLINFKPSVIITFTDGFIESDPRMPADIPFEKRVFLVNNFNIKGQKAMAGTDSVVKQVGKYVYGVKVDG